MDWLEAYEICEKLKQLSNQEDHWLKQREAADRMLRSIRREIDNLRWLIEGDDNGS